MNETSVLRLHVVDAKRGIWNAVLYERLLERLGGGMVIRLEEQLDAIRCLGRCEGEPAMLAHQDVVLRLES